MILDQQGNTWRATFSSSTSGVPRVEVFHTRHHRALEIAQTCQKVVRRKHPADFPDDKRSTNDVARDTLLGLAGVTFVGAHLLVGLAVTGLV